MRLKKVKELMNINESRRSIGKDTISKFSYDLNLK